MVTPVFQTLVASNVDDNSIGLGAPAGIDGRSIVSIQIVNGNMAITLSDGTVIQPGSVIGPAGRGVSNTNVNDSGHLIFSFTDGSSADLGQVTGRGIASVSQNGSGHLIITFSDNSTSDVGKVLGNTGATGLGISSATVNGSGHLILTMTDTTTIDCGNVVGPSGPGSGDVSGPSSSVDGELPVFSGTTGKLLKRTSQVVSAFVLSLLSSASASAFNTALGLGTSATHDVGTGASQVLQLDGAAKIPAVDASQLTNVPTTTKLLSTLTASSSATLDDTSSLTSAYDLYMIVMRNVVPANNGDNLKLRVKVGGTWQTAGYVNSGSTSTDGIDPISSSGSPVAISNDATSGGLSGVFYIHAPSNTATYKQMTGTAGAFSGAGTYPASVAGRLQAAAGAYVGGAGAVTGLRALMTTGNIASGIIQIYGIKTT